MEDDSYCVCALDGVISILGKKWVLLTVNSIGNAGTARFSFLLKELAGVSPSTLTYILRELEANGLIVRKSFPEIPPRVEYSLSDDGKRLREAMMPLLRWAAEKDQYKNLESSCKPQDYVRLDSSSS
ncbi:MAG: helix-turn-helix transcriptional regulator [Nitrososphaerota archaeon]|jgi:DNA-binding HxlR family transcriptional regulator|nr:helix-turn-helix transcriptional regulator [Nitrososphaerota archaeon]MDG6935295.1 helix-turn-helix transcriptional regulator [Nitrososphaerota archaeon]